MRAIASRIVFITLFGWSAVCAAGVTVENVRTWPAPDHTRVVFDLAAPVEHAVMLLTKPDRVVIDIVGARLAKKIIAPDSKDKLIARFRAAPRDDGDLRVVLDLKQAVRPKSFLLKPSDRYGYRLVVDLEPKGTPAASTPAALSRSRSTLRDLVIAIDAGHGGDDPGALGPKGTREKDVVFAIAKRLASLVEREPGMTAVMVRSGDYYVGLRKRMQIARKHNADLFISLHADAFKDSRVRGSSVYVLSRNGASSEAARWLANQENAADLAGGVSLDDKDDLLASVLLDLSQTATLNAGAEVAREVLGELARLGKTHKSRLQRAGFMVLKSPDIPSILVETAFISNPTEEKRLRDKAHQRALAEGIFRGVKRYFVARPPPGTLLAAREHTISRGETLSHIAQRYRISVKRLRKANGLKDDRLKIGQVLRIPVARDG